MSNKLVSSSPEIKDSSSWLKQRNGFVKCNHCKACQYGKNTTTYNTAFNTEPIEINKPLHCKTEYAIYILECTCQLKYVGSTKLPVSKRILQHIKAINNNDPTYPVARHFREVHANNLKDLSYYVIDTIPISRRGGNREKKLRKLETRYILNLDSKSPGGLNNTEDLYTCL